MAGFKAHMAFGIVTAVIWSGVVVIFSLLSPAFIPLIFIATVLGSFLPDLDSDGGRPLDILLSILSFIGGLNIGYIVFQSEGRTLIEVILYAIAYALFIYFVLGGIFKKLTVHRGMFHSLPAAFLSSLLALSFFSMFIVNIPLKVGLSISIGLGYLCHLVLDEMNSVVNLQGIPFIPNKALGSALKLFSTSLVFSFSLYLMILILILMHYNTIVVFLNSI